MDLNIKEAFSGKKKWIWIGGIGLVVVLVFVTRRSGGSGPQSAYVEGYPSTSGSGGGSGNADLSALTDTFTTSLDNIQTQFQEQTKKQQENFQKQIDALANAQAENANSFLDALNDVDSDYSKMVDHFNQQISSYQATIGSLNDRLDAATVADRVGSATPTSSQSTSSSKSSSSSSSKSSSGKSNQVVYLDKKKEEAKATGNKGLETWANQAKYLEDKAAEAKKTGNSGLAKWVASEQKKIGYK